MHRIPFPPMKYPLIAILRGLKPEETEGVVGALIEAGFTAIEIPLNSPEPFRSIEIAVKMAPAGCLIGAGTVLTTEQVERLRRRRRQADGQPQCRDGRDRACARPRHGDHARRLHPDRSARRRPCRRDRAQVLPGQRARPSGISAIRAVLPPELEIAAVGGVSEDNFADYAKIGVKSLRPRLQPLQAGHGRGRGRQAGAGDDRGL